MPFTILPNYMVYSATGFGGGTTDHNDAYNLSGNLYLTGSNLYNLINGTNHNDGINLSGQLQSTGSILYNDIIGLSGVLNSTGVILRNGINLVSGNLTTTGQTLYNFYTSLSGNLITTGQNLNNRIIGLSGDLASTGSILSIRLNNWGVTQITTTGVSLSGNVLMTGLGTVTVTTSGNTINISGSTVGVSANHDDGTNLSGNLYSTGSNLYNIITGVSGNWYKPTQLYSGFNPINIDWSSGSVFKLMLTGNISLNHVGNRDGQTIVIAIENTGGRGYLTNWQPTVHWSYNSAPVSTSGAMDVFTFICIHTGIYGNCVQNFLN